MKIIIDDKIPYIKEAAEKIAEEVIYAPGKDFTRELVQDADALIIRTRTQPRIAGRQQSKIYRHSNHRI
mgnify:CR=1 FL=1